MSGARLTSRVWPGVGVCVVALGIAQACAPKAAGRQTAVMEQQGQVTVSGAVLRARVNDLAGRLAGRVENTADRMRAATAELLAMDATEEREVQNVLGAADAAGAAARQASGLLGEVPGFVASTSSTVSSSMGSLLTAERRAVLADAERQRLATLEFVTSERLAVLAALREERLAFLDFFRQERIEGLNEADAIKTRGVDAAVVGLKEVVDYALWRVSSWPRHSACRLPARARLPEALKSPLENARIPACSVGTHDVPGARRQVGST